LLPRPRTASTQPLRAALAAAATAWFCATPAAAGPREACDYSARHGGVTCVVMVAEQIVHEQYRQAGDEAERWRLASGTKSFSGVLAAAAALDGLLSLDEPVADTLTEWRADERRSITIRQLLSLTSGIDTPAPGRGGRATPEATVARRALHPPGTHFGYGQAPFQIFAALMARKLQGETPEAYLHRRVLAPLGVTLEFKPMLLGGRGGTDWGGGGAMAARDWARFGEFVRAGGRWQGQPLVDAAVLAQNFSGSSTHAGYGLTWWLKPPPGAAVPMEGTTQNATDFFHGGATGLPVAQVWMAAGAGQQRLVIVPERQLVAVRQTARVLGGERAGFSDVAFLSLLLE
jgi:CubicO group peptidase (beta-lactamase class C family)